MQQDRQEIMRAGFDAFIEKPINLREFLDTVQKTLAVKSP
jgi:CheY-like chemotaxis protein